MMQRIAKKFILYLLFFSWLGYCLPVFATSNNDELSITQNRLDEFSEFLGISKFVSSTITQNKLTSPYSFLLVQPLMNLGIERFYQRTLRIQVLHEEVNQKDHTYTRAIQMLLEKEKAKNSEIVKPKQEGQLVVEVAFIKINFNELPQEIIKRILNTKIPLGKILSDNKINIISVERAYFSINCNVDLVRFVQCRKNSTIYGRINTLIRADNKKWIAQVVEILPGLKCIDTTCSTISEN
jgi:chorismate-pyruvate lyase